MIDLYLFFSVISMISFEGYTFPCTRYMQSFIVLKKNGNFIHSHVTFLWQITFHFKNLYVMSRGYFKRVNIDGLGTFFIGVILTCAITVFQLLST